MQSIRASANTTTVATTTARSTTARASSGEIPTTRVGTDPLEALLITTAPPGYVEQPDDVGDTGPSDFDKAVRDDGSDDAAAELTKDGFVRGYQRLWQHDEEHQIIVFLYQFANNAGATAYENRGVTGLQSEPSITMTNVAITNVPGATAFIATDAEPTIDSVTAALVYFTKGPYLVQIAILAPSAVGLPALGQQLAEAQYKRL